MTPIKITVVKEHFPCPSVIESEGWMPWMMSIPEMPGLVETGITEADAFNELMISLKVKIAYDNDIKL